MNKTKTVDFYKILNLGLDKLLLENKDNQGDCYINNYTKIEEALGYGVIAFKKRLSNYEVRDLVEKIQEKLFGNHISIDKETNTIKVDLSKSYTNPGRLDCVELHVFLANDKKAYNKLINNLDNIIFEANVDAYANLELISNNDSRFCSCQFNFYGENGSASALSAANIIENLLLKEEVGYRMSEVYNLEYDYGTCVALNRGKFHKRRELLFAELWNFLKDKDKLMMNDFKGEYDSLIEEFKKTR